MQQEGKKNEGKKYRIFSGPSDIVTVHFADPPVWDKDGWCKLPRKCSKEYFSAVYYDLMSHWLKKDDKLFTNVWLYQKMGTAFLDAVMCTCMALMAYNFWYRGFVVGSLLTLGSYAIDNINFMVAHTGVHVMMFVAGDATKGVRNWMGPGGYAAYIHHYLNTAEARRFVFGIHSFIIYRLSMVRNMPIFFFLAMSYYFDRMDVALAFVPFTIFWSLSAAMCHDWHHVANMDISFKEYFGIWYPLCYFLEKLCIVNVPHHKVHHAHGPISSKPHSIVNLAEMLVPGWLDRWFAAFSDKCFMLKYTEEDEGRGVRQSFFRFIFVYKHIKTPVMFWFWNLVLGNPLTADVTSTSIFIAQVFVAEIVYDTITSYTTWALIYFGLLKVNHPEN